MIKQTILLFSGIHGIVAPETTITLTFEYRDGKFVPVVHNNEDIIPSGMSTAAISSVFLLLLIMVCFIGNSLLIGTIASSISLKRYPFNLFLLNFGVICIIECVNIIMSVIYIMTQPWAFGQWPCNFNSYLMELVPFIYAIILLAIVIDRYVALRDPTKYKKHPEILRQKVFIVLYWILALVSVCPIAAGLISSWPFPDRYSCQPMEEVAVVYGIVTGSLCYLLSWIGIMLGLILIHRLFQAEKKKERKALRGREQTNKLAEPALFMMAMHHNVHFWNEVKSTGIVLGLIVIYLFLMLPYVIRVKVDQILQDYNHDYYRNLTLAYYLIPAENTTVNTTIMPPTSTGVVSLTTLLDTSGNDTLEDQSDVELVEHNPLLVPEVQEEFLGVIDVVCIWLRYVHAALVPMLIFLLHKDLRKKAEEILCCWRPNSVESKASKPTRPISAYMHRKRREWEKKQKKFKNIANFNVPVLFASSEGLYLRLVDENYGSHFPPPPEVPETKDLDEDILDDSIKAQWSVEPKFVMEVCDLELPMSANRSRTVPDQGQQDFGTTVTVIVGKKDPNLKSSLKKPRGSPEVDEGFIDASSDPPTKKVVQFNTHVQEIPLLTNLEDHPEEVRPKLPPLSSSPEKSNKKKTENESPRRRKPEISWNLQPKEAKNHRQTRSSAEVEMIEMEVRN